MPVYLSNASSLHSLTITLFYQSKYLEHINDIEDHKIIILQMHGRHFEAYIERSMDEKAIYEALQIVLSSELDNNLDGNQCIIYDSVRNRRARLHYDEMNPNIIYTVEPTFSHVHGSKAGSGAARRLPTTSPISSKIGSYRMPTTSSRPKSHRVRKRAAMIAAAAAPSSILSIGAGHSRTNCGH
ncbi:hypothetical protein Ptr902_03975 [Pyrenophora tritici-repentis]|nr:hypothetical protein Ptr902_03975 [Pyrenophora tritici-repentis]